MRQLIMMTEISIIIFLVTYGLAMLTKPKKVTKMHGGWGYREYQDISSKRMAVWFICSITSITMLFVTIAIIIQTES